MSVNPELVLSDKFWGFLFITSKLLIIGAILFIPLQSLAYMTGSRFFIVMSGIIILCLMLPFMVAASVLIVKITFYLRRCV